MQKKTKSTQESNLNRIQYKFNISENKKHTSRKCCYKTKANITKEYTRQLADKLKSEDEKKNKEMAIPPSHSFPGHQLN